MSSDRTIVLVPGEGQNFSIAGAQVSFKVTDANTAGAWSLLEYTAPPRFTGPAPHWHKVMVEAFYVLDGTVTFTLDRQTLKAAAGSFVLVPTRVVHKFANVEELPARFLIHMSPAGLEKYFAELAEMVKSEPHWPPADMSKVMALASKYDTYQPPVE